MRTRVGPRDMTRERHNTRGGQGTAEHVDVGSGDLLYITKDMIREHGASPACAITGVSPTLQN